MFWRGVVIAEGLRDPQIINNLRVYGANVSDRYKAIDYEGGSGRWHIYWVQASDADIDTIQEGILHGWYAHFWRNDNLLVIFDDERFSLSRSRRSTWEAARKHGLTQGIPTDELDFLVEEPDPAQEPEADLR